MNLRVFAAAGLIAISALISFYPTAQVRSIGPSSEIQNKLNSISIEEKEILQNLLALEHKLAKMEADKKELENETDSLNKEIYSLKSIIANQENDYTKKLNAIKQILRLYQRKGPGSYLEVILNSENLSMFLWRISTLQDISHNTGELLKSLEESKNILADKKAGLEEKRGLMESKQKQLKEALDGTLQLKEEKENYLASLNEQKSYYEEELYSLQQEWNDLKLLFSNISEEFFNTIKDADLPPDAVKMTFSFEGIEASIDEKTFNDIISKDSSLPLMTFTFHSGKVDMEVPEMSFNLTGTFEISNGNTLKIIPDKVSFYGMPLEPEAAVELFQKGYLILDLTPVIGTSTLDSVEITEGNLKFMIKSFFYFINRRQ